MKKGRNIIKTMKFPSAREALYRTMHNTHINYRNYNQGICRLRHWLGRLKEPPTSILEVGCGNGILCDSLTMMGYNVVGLDIVPGPYDRKKYEFIIHDIQLGFLPFRDNEFDYCVSFDVLEHLPQKRIGQTIYEMQRVSTKGVIGTAACFEIPFLHLTVKDKTWWMEKISRILDAEVDYIIDHSPAGETVLFQTKPLEEGVRP